MVEKKKSITALLGKYFSIACGTLTMLTLGIFSPKNRTRMARVAEEFGWKNPKKAYKLILPAIDIKNGFPGGEHIRILSPMGNSGNVSLTELLIINSVVSIVKPKKIFEIGTFDGRTALNMAANA